MVAATAGVAGLGVKPAVKRLRLRRGLPADLVDTHSTAEYRPVARAYLELTASRARLVDFFFTDPARWYVQGVPWISPSASSTMMAA